MIRRDRTSATIVAIAIVAAIFLLGGALRWTQAVVASLAAAGVALTIGSRRVLEQRPPLLLFLGVAASCTALQLVPLPEALVRALSPTLHELRNEGAQLAGVSPLSTLSMDPAGTLRALTFFVTLSGIGVLALRVSASERGRYVLLACVAGGAGLAAGVAGVHELTGATALYGFYEPTQLPPILGPLINPNHLGCLAAVGAVTSVGLLLYPKQPIVLWVTWLAVALLCVITTTATYSRGATIGVAAGLAVTFATLIAQRVATREGPHHSRRRDRFFVTTLPIAVMVVCSLIVAVYLGASTVMSQLSSTSLDELRAPRTKFAAWRAAQTLVEESPWSGVGRGAFESAFTRVHPASAYATFSHPENEIVQAVVEWGIPACLVLAVILGWMLLIAIRRWRDGPLAAGALGALMVVAFQSNFDFGVELLGLAVPVVVVTATLTYGAVREVSETRLRRIRLLRAGHVAALLAGAALLLTGATRTIAEDHERLRRQPSPAAIAAAIEARPLDYFPYSVFAQELFRVNDPNAVAVLNHALRLHPTHPALHRIAARLLVRTGRLAQAESEYMMAVRYSTDPRAVIDEMITVLPPDRAAAAIPMDMPIEAVIRLVQFDIAAIWLERVLVLREDIRAADTLYNLGTRFKNWSIAETGARFRCKRMPSSRCSLELAKVLIAAGKPKAASEVLANVSKWTGPREDRLAAWELLCDARRAAGEADAAADCERRLELTKHAD